MEMSMCVCVCVCIWLGIANLHQMANGQTVSPFVVVVFFEWALLTHNPSTQTHKKKTKTKATAKSDIDLWSHRKDAAGCRG